MTDLKILKLKIRDIDNRFCVCDYGGIEVIINTNTGYINGNKISNQDGKRFSNWMENKSTKELITCVDEELTGSSLPGIQGSEQKSISTIYIESAIETRGTYIHQLLLPHLLSWLSPKFAIKISMIVNKYLVDEKDKKIFDLEALNRKLDEQFSLIKNQNNLLLTKNDSLSIEVGSLKYSITSNNTKVNDSTDIIYEQLNKLVISAPPQKEKDIHFFVLLYKDDGGYYCLRRKYLELNKEIKRIGGDVLYFVQTGNAFSLYDALKNSGIIVYTKNNFRLKDSFTQKDLFRILYKILKEIGEPIENIKESMKHLIIDLDDEKD